MSTVPNIVFVVTDQMRHDAGGFAGSQVVATPTLDAMAARGVWFLNAYCGSPLCSPSRGSLLTGLYPHRHLQLDNYSPRRGGRHGHHLPGDLPTLGDLLSAAGYRCGMVGNWHLGDDATPQHGFDHWCSYHYQDKSTDRYEQYLARVKPEIREMHRIGTLPAVRLGEAPVGLSPVATPHQRTSWAVSEAIDFLAEATSPFFLYLSIKDPHPPWLPPPEWVERYAGTRMPLPAGLHDSLDGKPQVHRTCPQYCAASLSNDAMGRTMTHYYALVSHVDDQLARLFDTLVRHQRLHDTIVAFTSDHGEMMGNHGMFTKRLMYEESSRVPCLLQWAGTLPAGLTSAEPFAGVDLMPTLLELAGVALPSAIHGRSVASDLLAGREPSAHTVFSQCSSIDGGVDDPRKLATTLMVRRGSWKYVCNRFDIDELYDLATDPGEVTNLIGTDGDQLEPLRAAAGELLSADRPSPYDWFLDGDGVQL